MKWIATRSIRGWCVSVGMVSMVAATSVGAVPIPGQGTWETDLKARDIDGNPLPSLNDPRAVFYYDVPLDITWLRNWNAGAGTAYDNGDGSDGLMSWANAMAWVGVLKVGRFTGWRLPTTKDTGSTGCDFAYVGTDCGYNVSTSNSELAHMFQVTLGNKPFHDTSGSFPQVGSGLTNTAVFANMQSYGYWYGTEFPPFVPFSEHAWSFYTSIGLQAYDGKSHELYVTAVLPGDVLTPVPEPTQVAMLIVGLGVAGFAATRRSRSRHGFQ